MSIWEDIRKVILEKGLVKGDFEINDKKML